MGPASAKGLQSSLDIIKYKILAHVQSVNHVSKSETGTIAPIGRPSNYQ
jgi:hypothetical protein